MLQLQNVWNFGGNKKKKSVVQSLVERLHLLARCIQGTSHPVAAVHTKGKWRGEESHSLSLNGESLFRWLLLGKTKQKRLCIDSLQTLSPSVSHAFDECAVIKVSRDMRNMSFYSWTRAWKWFCLCAVCLGFNMMPHSDGALNLIW